MNSSYEKSSPLENRLWGPDWPTVRAMWSLDESVAHLNHGSFGAVPIRVQNAQEKLRRQVEANPMRKLSRDFVSELDQARLSAAEFLRADPKGFAFVPNVTTGINTVLTSFPNLKGGEVLVTDQTYGAVRYAAERTCAMRGAKMTVAPVPLPISDGNELLDAVLSSTTKETRIAIVDHIASPTGLVFPIDRLVRELQSGGVSVLVDGAHAPGMVDLDLDSLGAEFWTGNFHKWCCAPRGSAGLWVREDRRNLVSPLVVSWQFGEGYPSSFRWLGTDDYTPYLATPSALSFMADLGWDRVRSHNRRLARLGRDLLASALNVPPSMRVDLDGVFEAMTLVRLPDGIVASDEDARLLQREIAETLSTEASPVAWNGRGFVRLSAQVYNSPSDFERLARGLPDMLGDRAKGWTL